MPTETVNSPPPSKDWWEKFKITSWFIVAVATLVWTVVSWWLLQYHEQRASEKQAQAAVESRTLQREISGAQLATSLIPSLTKGTEPDRRIALLVLASVAPDIAENISTTLAQNAKTPGEKQLVQEATDISKQSKEGRDFLQHLENARIYQRFQLYGQADHEYISASGRIPSRFSVDRKKIDDAKSAYSSDRFFEAARIFEEAFRGISTQ
ncbi:MAG TPA: hypothetical protein VI386_05945 [Candidatus Sulfotelmatobacter sp.]